jgi:hypothetical protein
MKSFFVFLFFVLLKSNSFAQLGAAHIPYDYPDEGGFKNASDFWISLISCLVIFGGPALIAKDRSGDESGMVYWKWLLINMIASFIAIVLLRDTFAVLVVSIAVIGYALIRETDKESSKRSHSRSSNSKKVITQKPAPDSRAPEKVSTSPSQNPFQTKNSSKVSKAIKDTQKIVDGQPRKYETQDTNVTSQIEKSASTASDINASNDQTDVVKNEFFGNHKLEVLSHHKGFRRLIEVENIAKRSLRQSKAAQIEMRCPTCKHCFTITKNQDSTITKCIECNQSIVI